MPGRSRVLLARCPSPPMPKMATRSVGRTSATLIALYVVTPAHVKGGGLQRANPVGHPNHGACVRDRVVGMSAVDRVAGVLLRLAKPLPAVDAVAADPTGVTQPGDRDPVPTATPAREQRCANRRAYAAVRLPGHRDRDYASAATTTRWRLSRTCIRLVASAGPGGGDEAGGPSGCAAVRRWGDGIDVMAGAGQ